MSLEFTLGTSSLHNTLTGGYVAALRREILPEGPFLYSASRTKPIRAPGFDTAHHSGDDLRCMTLDDAIRGRRSVRGFLDTEVPHEVQIEVLQLAQLAPSNCNAQPWQVHVVSGAALESLRQSLVAASSSGLPTHADWPADIRRFRGIHRTRQIDAAVKLYGAMGVGRDDLSGRRSAFVQNFAFFGAPHTIFIFLHDSFGPREVNDMGIYAQTLLLAMTSRGIASCAQGALGEYPDIVRRHLGLGIEERLMFGISFGYEDPAVKANAARVGRAPLEEVVRFHR